jgi:hypothetical protein
MECLVIVMAAVILGVSYTVVYFLDSNSEGINRPSA